MLPIYTNIKTRRKQLKMTQDDLAKRAGYTDRSSISRIEKGEIDLPQSKIELFAQILGCTESELMGWNKEDELKKMPRTKRIPLLGKIACGNPITAIENPEQYVDVPEFVSADFALTCAGDSMINARIFDGDVVYIRKQNTIDNGEIAAVMIDGEATLKRVYFQNGVMLLRAENPTYPPIIITDSDLEGVQILGKATHFVSRVI